MKPNQYIVRSVYMNTGPATDRRVFAYTAEDAVFQVTTMLGKPRFEEIIYVGPVNPDCKCSGDCRCGVSA